MKIEKQALENILNHANDLWNDRNGDRQELVITFSGLPASELVPVESVIAENSIVSSSRVFSTREIDKIKDPVIKVSIDMEKLGFAAADISGTIENYCEKLRDGFIHKNDIQIIKSPLIVACTDYPSDVLESIDTKKECFDLISNLSDDKSNNLLFYAKDILRIENYSFSYGLCKEFDLDVAIEILSYFSNKEDSYTVKCHCFKEELVDILSNTSKENRCTELFKHLDEIFINTKARVGRYIKRTSEASVNISLKNITEKYLPMLSTSIQTMTADIMALVGNIVLLSNIDFANPLTISNTVFLFISALFDILFSFLMDSRRKNITFIYNELLETEKELKDYNPEHIEKITKQIGKLKNQADYTKGLFAITIVFIWIPIIVAVIGLYTPLILQFGSKIACMISVRIIS